MQKSDMAISRTVKGGLSLCQMARMFRAVAWS